MKQCPNCQNQLSENAKFCTRCGTKIVSEEAILKTESQLICSCGAELKPGAKFCTTCGKKVEAAEIKTETVKDNLCSCGAELKPGAKFCTSCGKPVVMQQTITPPAQPKVVTSQPVIQQTPPVAQVSAAMPKKKKRVFLKVAAAILIVAVLGGGGYWAYNEFFGGIRKKLLVEQKISVSDKDQTVKYEDEISVKVPWGLIDKEQTMSIYSVKGLPGEDGLTQLGAYDVNMSDMKEFDGFLEITISYNPEDLPAGADAGKDLFCMYLNEKTNKWENVPCIVDAANHKLTIYTNHLSTFAPWISTEKVQPGPMMTIKNVKYPGGEFMTQERVEMDMERYSQMEPASLTAYKVGWSKVNEWFGITSNVSTFTEHALEVGALQGVNEIATEAGLAFAFLQAAIDVSEGKTGKATLELAKNAYNYWAVKLINTSAINLAFVGVFCIDYSLNKFIEAAITQRTQLYQVAYDMYYQDKVKERNIDGVYWYKTIKKTMKSVKSPDEAQGAVEKLIRDYTMEFWNSDVVVAEYMDLAMKRDHRFTGGGYLSEELKNNIANEQYNSIMHTLVQTNVFKRITTELTQEMQWNLFQQLNKIKDKLNVVNTVRVVVKLDPECEEYNDVEVGGLKVTFEVSNPVHKKLWEGTTDKDGILDFKCTTLGYVDAGCPTLVKVIVKGPAGKDEEFTGEMALAGSGKTTVVEIMIGAPKLEGTWKLDATITKMTMDASLQYMDQMADFYGSGDDYRKERKNVEEQMKGQKAQLPDLKLDGIEYIMDVKREGQYYIIQSKNFNDNTALGSVQYKIKFTSRNTFEGTYIGLNHLNGKENRTEMDLKGTRLK